MKKLVLDTNVFVAAGFNKRSSSAAIFKMIDEEKVQMVWNQPTKRETKQIVSTIPPISWKKFEGYFRSEDEFTGKTNPGNYTLVDDEDDRKFAALAEAADAVLISNDDHLLSARHKVSIQIFTPKEFIQSL